MQYKQFMDMNISTLGMGVMRLPEIEGRPGVIDRDKGRAIIDRAFSGGINYFDTAHIYQDGDSEKFIGEVLSSYPRESYYLATKFKVTDAKDIKEMFNRQLKRCNTEYFDIYLLHNITAGTFDEYTDPANGYLEFLLEQQKEGRIRHLGFSSHGTPDIIQKVLDWHRFDMAQIQLNYLDWTLQDAKAKCQLLRRHNIPVWVMEPVRGGKLATLSAEDEAALKALRGDETIPAWCFRWLQGVEGVTMVLSGMSNMEQMVDNVKTFDAPKPLSGEETELLLAIAEKLKNAVPCTACRYCCDGCPMGLDIPALLAIYNDLKVAPTFLLGMRVEALPPEKRPDACLACGKCSAICPQHIDIPAALADMAAILKDIPSWEAICREREAAAKKK